MKEPLYIELRGTPKERGFAHGKAAASLIAQNIEFYKGIIRVEDTILRAEARKFAQKIGDIRPDLLEEMLGIAEGAGVEPEYIFMINARTELLSLNGVVQSECATFFFGPTGILFQNWDWSEGSRDLTVVLSIELKDKKILTFCEAGMLGKIGLSSKGFGVAFNYLYPAARLSGLPVHGLLRMALEADSYSDAHALLSQDHLGTSGNILLGDASGSGTDFEFSGVATAALPLKGAALAHTNHYLSDTQNDPKAGNGFLNNSFERYARAESLLNAMPELDEDAAQKILTNREPGEGMLCRDFLPEEPGESSKTGTIASIIMNLKAQTMKVALDPQTQSKFKTYSLS